MIAEVIPLIRLPRRFAFFDYTVSADASIGDIVSIGFKGRGILGVIREIKSESKHKLQEIKFITQHEFLSFNDVRRLESIALSVAQSPSTIFYTALFGLRAKQDILKFEKLNYPKLLLDKETANQITNIISNLKNQNELFCQISSEGALTLAYALTKQFNNQILIIAPHERDVKVIHKLINFKKNTAVLHGKTVTTQKNAIIQDWQAGKIKVLISTRQGSLLPAKKIDSIVVIDSNSKDHKNWDRNPRYDARLAVKLLAKQHSAKLVFTGPLPRVLDISENRKTIWSEVDNANLINLSAPEESSGLPMISESLKKEITTTLAEHKSVLLYYNRKGVANRLQCQVCKHIPFCGTCGANPVVREDDLVCPVCKTEMWIPKQCPACGSEKLKPKGVGNKRIKSELQKIYPHVKISIIDKQNIEDLKADVLIVTEYFFQAIYRPFMNKRFGLVSDLCLDLGLGSEYDSAELTAAKLSRLQMIARQQKANCLIQTWIPDLIAPMLKNQQYLNNELAIRTKYKLFPAFELITKRCPGKNPEVVLHSATIKNDEKLALTNIPNSCIIETELKNYGT